MRGDGRSVAEALRHLVQRESRLRLQVNEHPHLENQVGSLPDKLLLASLVSAFSVGVWSS